ncbi:MAG: hypothetical protein K9H61_09385 [Bacteroidia bacterium]|nr:hypothetical protein [Bacteroidia bacterium]MCF8425337.1 hypothetical protein [Bacteroidia bacterium]MCF8447194.1 hypothetical protein [Bacteroidia bacterium]
MSLIENIKNKIGRILLKKPVNKQNGNTSIPTFSQIQDIGIIYNADTKEHEQEINLVANYLREQGKKVWMMGYVNSKTLPENKKFHISSEYFWKEKLTFFNLPDPNKIGNFISHPFDLMMNLYFEKELPLEALSTLCKSKYSMGVEMPGNLAYNDGLISLGSNRDIKNLASQIVHYLNVINQK